MPVWRASCYHDAHGSAPAQIEQRGGACAVGGDLEMVGAAEERADLAGSRVRVGGTHSLHLVGPHVDLDCVAAWNHDRVERPSIDVRDQIAEAIEPQHLAPYGARSRFD